MTWRQFLLVAGTLILTVGFAGYLGAEDPEHYEGWVKGVDTVDPEKLQPNWGTGDPIPIALQSAAFDGINANHDSVIQVALNGSYKFCSDLCILIAPFNPTNGSIADSLFFRGYDTDPIGKVSCSLFECSDDAESCDQLSIFGSDNPFVGGFFASNILISPPLTFDTSQNTYAIRCLITGGTIDTRLGNFRIKTFLQVSPAPAVATFSDVPTGHLFFQHIEALAASEITAGCGGGNYCPDAPVTRGQMAVFLAKALGLHWPG